MILMCIHISRKYGFHSLLRGPPLIFRRELSVDSSLKDSCHLRGPVAYTWIFYFGEMEIPSVSYKTNLLQLSYFFLFGISKR